MIFIHLELLNQEELFVEIIKRKILLKKGCFSIAQQVSEHYILGMAYLSYGIPEKLLQITIIY